MRTRRTSEHDAALSRRLAQLGDELSSVRSARPEPPATDLTTAPWWDDHTRPAAPRRPPPARPPAPRPLVDVAPPPLAPGRHALRSRGPGRLGAAQLAVVAVVVAVGLAVTCWWLVRGSAHEAPALAAAPAPGLVSASPAVEPVGDASGAGPSAGSSSGAAPATVTVDVAGKVRHPGIAVLDAGARVVDALKAAGGARPGVDLSGLNLARVLVDGEQVVVGGPAPSGAAAAASPPVGDPSAPVALVNLNTASETELDTLPEVGPVTAASILQWRDQHGGFTSVDELLEVDGIGEVTLGKLAPYVTV
jgi:competence protein ComEA